MYPADLLTGSSLSLGYQLGAAAAAASPWRQLYMPASPAGDHRYHHSHSPLTSTIAMSPHQLHHQQQSVWSPISAFTHPAAAAGFTEGMCPTTSHHHRLLFSSLLFGADSR